MLTDPAAFQIAVQGLLKAQKEAIELHAGGEHLCFIFGDTLEYVYMVIASFLQKNTKYISLLNGGFKAIHEYFGDHMLDCLENHDYLQCSVCKKKNKIDSTHEKKEGTEKQLPSNTNTEFKVKPSADIMGKLTSVMKKSAEVKEKFFEYIVNPSQSPSQSAPLGK